MKECIDSDRRMTCEEIGCEIGSRHSSVYAILTQRLRIRKVTAKWVPHCLTKDQISRRLEVAEMLLNRYEREGDFFFLVSQPSMRSYEPEMNSQSAEWHTPA